MAPPPLFPADGLAASGAAMTLDRLAVGRGAVIARVDWDALAPDEAQRLRALGFDIGARVAVAHRGVLGGADPLAVAIGRMNVALRRVHAAAMTVELEAPGAPMSGVP